MILTALLAASLAAPVPKSLKRQAETLDGTWEIVGFISEGDELFRPVGSGPKLWMIDGETLTKSSSEWDDRRGTTFTLRQRPDVGPRAFDYLMREVGLPDKILQSVYELNGGELRVCWSSESDERPDDCKPGKGRFVVVLKRVTTNK